MIRRASRTRIVTVGVGGLLLCVSATCIIILRTQEEEQLATP
jgi:hypothetical protein